jgi:hypothetical protein
LASLNTNPLTEGLYTIKVVLQVGSESIFECVRIKLDKTIHAGYPYDLGMAGGNGWANTPTLIDLDHDGIDEILVNTLTGIHVFKGDGSIMSGWPVLINSGISGILETPGLSAADIDADGEIEICLLRGDSLNVYQYLYVFTATGDNKP